MSLSKNVKYTVFQIWMQMQFLCRKYFDFRSELWLTIQLLGCSIYRYVETGKYFKIKFLVIY